MRIPDEETATVLSSSEIRDEELDVTFLLWLTARATAALMDATVAPSGLTGDEFAVYSILASSEATTPSTLARWMAAPPTTVSSYVKRLEARGHVIRKPNPNDKRSYRIVLTPAGRDTHGSAQQAFRPVSSALSAALGAEESTVTSALITFRPVIDALRNQPENSNPPQFENKSDHPR